MKNGMAQSVWRGFSCQYTVALLFARRTICLKKRAAQTVPWIRQLIAGFCHREDLGWILLRTVRLLRR